MAFKIEQGLFTLDFIDYHAVLGIPIDADAKEIRKRYLNIARRLHPDSSATENEADRQRASEFLSKLVNPAYEKLSQEKNYSEYTILLRLKGQQALRQQETVVLTADSARRLASASDLDNTYRAALKELTERQYQQLDQTLDLIGQISELNLVYLMRKEKKGEATIQPPKASAAGPAARPQPATAQPPVAAAPSHEALIEAYLRRAQEFENKKDYAKTLVELRDALKLDPTNSTCHSRLGMVYLKLSQPTMAKIHFKKALELNPQDAVALEGKRKLESPNGKAATPTKPEAKGKKPDPKKGKPNAQGGSGGLFGLFGGKKK